MKKIHLLFGLSAILVLAACKKDKTNPNDQPGINEINVGTLDLGSKVSASFFGEVKDESGQGIAGVQITVGNKTTVTDEDGVFMVENASVHEKLAYIKAEKTGYFTGSRSLIPNTNSVNIAHIELLTLAVTGTVMSGQVATVTTPEGASVDLKGAYVDENGNPYSGSVDVALKYLPPKAEATPDQMPGMLYAQNQDGYAGVLETYGMVAVELIGSSGEHLQIAKGSDAVIRMPVDPSQIGGLPSGMPLWYFDEENGYWVEEGSAVVDNDHLVGLVDHFSFWNCDVFGDGCTINGHVEDQNGVPLVGVDVTIITNNAQTTGSTGSNGDFFSYIPAGQTITFEITDICGNLLFSQTVGPFASNSNNTQTFIANTPQVNYIYVVGIAQDCQGQPISYGFAEITVAGNSYFCPLNNGTINFSLLDCNSQYTSVDAYVYNGATTEEGAVANVPIVSGTADVGIIQTCSAGASEYISLYFSNSFGNVSAYTWLAPIQFDEYYDTVNQNTMFYIASDPGQSGNFSLTSSTITPGVHGFVTNPYLATGMKFHSTAAPSNITDPNPNVDCVFNTYPAVGDYIELNITGTYNPGQQGTSDIGIFIKAIRDS